LSFVETGEQIARAFDPCAEVRDGIQHLKGAAARARPGFTDFDADFRLGTAFKISAEAAR